VIAAGISAAVAALIWFVGAPLMALLSAPDRIPLSAPCKRCHITAQLALSIWGGQPISVTGSSR
jgi:hypothetical protein